MGCQSSFKRRMLTSGAVTRRTRNLDGGSQTPHFPLGQQLLPWPTHPSSASSASLYELQQDRFSKNLLLAVASNLGISAETTVLPIYKQENANQSGYA